MKHKTLIRNKNHKNEKSYDIIIIKIEGGVIIKMTYEAYNARESFTGETWDGIKWNPLFTLLDLGINPESNMYIRSNEIRMARVEELLKLGLNFIDIIFN